MWCQKIVSKANADLKYCVISAFIRPCKRAEMQNHSRNVQDEDSRIDGWLCLPLNKLVCISKECK